MERSVYERRLFARANQDGSDQLHNGQRDRRGGHDHPSWQRAAGDVGGWKPYPGRTRRCHTERWRDRITMILRDLLPAPHRGRGNITALDLRGAARELNGFLERLTVVTSSRTHDEIRRPALPDELVGRDSGARTGLIYDGRWRDRAMYFDSERAPSRSPELESGTPRHDDQRHVRRDLFDMGFVGTAVVGHPETKQPVLATLCDLGCARTILKIGGDILSGMAMPLYWIDCDPIEFAAWGGCSLSPSSSRITGTLGAWLDEANEGVIGVSNHHVLTDYGRCARIGHDVLHPGVRRGNSTSVGSLAGWIDVQENTSQSSPNEFDVAWCKPHSLNDVDFGIDDGSGGKIRPRGEMDLMADLAQGNPVDVFQAGNVTGGARGVAVGLAADIVVHSGPRRYRFANQMLLDIPAQLGDSGAVVLADGDKIAGLFFATDRASGTALANPWLEFVRQKNFRFRY